MKINPNNITIFTYYYPNNNYSALVCQESIRKYCLIHGYNFYLSITVPYNDDIILRYFMKLKVIEEAIIAFPETEWFLWLDSDIYIENYDMKIEENIDFSGKTKYHFFHEKPWGFKLNSGVRFIHKSDIQHELSIFSFYETGKYSEKTAYEQGAIIDYLSNIKDEYLIHDPYILNCIYFIHKKYVKRALFIHLAGAHLFGVDRNIYMENINKEQNLNVNAMITINH